MERSSRHAPRGALARETLVALIAQELTIREIASVLDRSPTAVRHWLKRYGLRTIRARGVAPGTAPSARTAGDCPRHGPVEYVRRGDGAWRCVVCRIEAVHRRRRAIKQTLVADAGGACVLCGYDRCLAALEFHHRDPADKSFELARTGVSRSLASARAEAAKCVLLCSNCHAEVESGEAHLPS